MLESDRELADLLRSSRTIAALGIKPESRAHKPAHYVPRYLADVGYQIIPVPVYYPEVEQILGQRVYRSVASIPGAVDVVVVFRRPEQLMPHLPDLLGKRPRAVWLQTGIRHDVAARLLAEAGILLVQDRCMMVEHERLLGANKKTR